MFVLWVCIESVCFWKPSLWSQRWKIHSANPVECTKSVLCVVYTNTHVLLTNIVTTPQTKYSHYHPTAHKPTPWHTHTWVYAVYMAVCMHMSSLCSCVGGHIRLSFCEMPGTLTSGSGMPSWWEILFWIIHGVFSTGVSSDHCSQRWHLLETPVTQLRKLHVNSVLGVCTGNFCCFVSVLWCIYVMLFN